MIRMIPAHQFNSASIEFYMTSVFFDFHYVVWPTSVASVHPSIANASLSLNAPKK